MAHLLEKQENISILKRLKSNLKKSCHTMTLQDSQQKLLTVMLCIVNSKDVCWVTLLCGTKTNNDRVEAFTKLKCSQMIIFVLS